MKLRILLLSSVFFSVSALLLTILRIAIPDFPLRVARSFGSTPGLNYEKFGNESWSGSAVERGIVSALDFTQSSSDLFRGDHFSLLFNGWLYVPRTGPCQFELLSDDGSDVYLGEELLIADPGYHPMRAILRNQDLKKGWHPIRVKMFNRDADSGLRLSWKCSSDTMLALDERFLFVEKPPGPKSLVYEILLSLDCPEANLLLYFLAALTALLVFAGRVWKPLIHPYQLFHRYRVELATGFLLFLVFASAYHLPALNPVPHGFAVEQLPGSAKSDVERELVGTSGRFHSHTHRAARHSNTHLKLSGWLNIPASGDYGFSVESNDSAVLRISEAEVLISSLAISYRKPVTNRIQLSQGLHSIDIEFSSKQLPVFLDLKWAGPESDRFRPIPTRRLFRTFPTSEDLKTDREFQAGWLTLVIGLFLAAIAINLWRLRKRVGEGRAPSVALSFAIFLFFFLNHVPFLHFDHQAGLRWFAAMGLAGRLTVSSLIFLLFSGCFSAPLRWFRSFLKQHPRLRFAIGLFIVSLLITAQYLFGISQKKEEYLIPGCLIATAAFVVWSSGFPLSQIRKPAGAKHFGRWRRICFMTLLASVIAWSVFVRFHRLDEMPPGLWWDEAQTGRVVRSIQNGEIPPVYDLRINAGTVASYLNTAWCYLVETTSPWGLRSYTAFIGVMTVIVSWWFFRQMFSPWWSLFGMSLLAGSRWLFTINRTAMATIDETILLTFLILTFYIKAQRCHLIRHHVITGLLLGLAMHLHTGARVLPVIIGADLVIRCFTNTRRPVRQRLRNAGILIACAVFSFAPMGLYIIQNFDDFMRRSRETLLSTEYPGWYPVKPYLDNIRYYLEMYVVRGDWHPRHNFERTPQLASIVSVLAALGAFLSTGKWIKHPLHRLLFISFGLITVQGVMTVHMDGPNLNRVAENIPVVFAWAVFGAEFIYRGITAIFPKDRGRIPAISLAILATILAARMEYDIYFNRYLPWPSLAEVYGFQPDVTEMARLAGEFIKSDPEVHVWAMYAAGDPFQYIYPPDERIHAISVETPPPPADGTPMVILIPANESRMREVLARLYPDAPRTIVRYQLNPQIPLVMVVKVDFPEKGG